MLKYAIEVESVIKNIKLDYRGFAARAFENILLPSEIKSSTKMIIIDRKTLINIGRSEISLS